MQQLAGERTWPVLLVKAYDRLRSMKPGICAAGLPKGRVQPQIEFVVDRQEVADVVPSARVEDVVKVHQGRGRRAQAISERICQSDGFDADHLQGSRFEWFDEPDRIADADDVADPIADITAGAVLHDARFGGHF